MSIAVDLPTSAGQTSLKKKKSEQPELKARHATDGLAPRDSRAPPNSGVHHVCHTCATDYMLQKEDLSDEVARLQIVRGPWLVSRDQVAVSGPPTGPCPSPKSTPVDPRGQLHRTCSRPRWQASRKRASATKLHGKLLCHCTLMLSQSRDLSSASSSELYSMFLTPLQVHAGREVFASFIIWDHVQEPCQGTYKQAMGAAAAHD